MATEADYQWVTKPQFAGNAQSANDYIVSVINGVDVIYRRDLKLTVQITYQHAWTMPDQYQSGSLSNTLNSFKNIWNADPQFNQVHRDLAHLFTGKHSDMGLSFIGVVCKFPLNGYGVSGYIDFPPNRQIGLAAQTALTAHEIGHNLGGNHVSNSGGCFNTIMIEQVNETTMMFCEFSINEITDFINSRINAGSDCLATEFIEPNLRTLYDFDADGKADIGVFRPSVTPPTWYTQQSTAGFSSVQFGQATDKLAPADYDNDGKTDYGVFRPSENTWYILRSSLGFLSVPSFGIAGDIPVPGDFSGDRQAEVAVFRPSNGAWYTYNLVNGRVVAVQFGQNGDKPQIGDFDADGKNDYAVFRPSDATWYILKSTAGFSSFQFGAGTDIPAPADYDGDRQTDIAVFRPSSNANWYVQKSTTGFSSFQFGLMEDIPTQADYDGDGKADYSVYRPSNTTWYRFNSSNNAFVAIFFGASGDIPIPAFNVVQ